MTYTLYLGTTVREMPHAFKNLFDHVYYGVDDYQLVNDFLETEPYTACLMSDHKTSYTDLDWWMEFGSEEDYIAFLMKWS